VSDGRKTTGSQGEAQAAEYLLSRGYTILQTNWRCRRGEIDIIAQDGATLVFVEVRTRSSARLGSPEESVTIAKQRRLAELAQVYLQFREAAGKPWPNGWRIDVIAIRTGSAGRLNHLMNAVEGVY
jgi:putative endonuclease